MAPGSASLSEYDQSFYTLTLNTRKYLTTNANQSYDLSLKRPDTDHFLKESMSILFYLREV